MPAEEAHIHDGRSAAVSCCGWGFHRSLLSSCVRGGTVVACSGGVEVQGEGVRGGLQRLLIPEEVCCLQPGRSGHTAFPLAEAQSGKRVLLYEAGVHGMVCETE